MWDGTQLSATSESRNLIWISAGQTFSETWTHMRPLTHEFLHAIIDMFYLRMITRSNPIIATAFPDYFPMVHQDGTFGYTDTTPFRGYEPQSISPRYV
jgi:hypothetical protein